MQMMLSHTEPGDWIVATGESRSIRDLCNLVFSRLGMDYRQYVVQNEKHLRPEELNYLRGDSSRFRSTFGWKPDYDFASIIEEIINFWEPIITKKAGICQ